MTEISDMSRAIFYGSMVGCALSSTIAAAHPGHGTSNGQSAEHYLVEPNHLLPWLAGLALVLGLRHLPRWGRRPTGESDASL